MLNNLVSASSFKQAFLVLIDQGVASLSFFLIGAVLARAIDKESFAVYLLANSVLLIILGFQKALINTPFTINYPNKSGEEKLLYLGDTLILHLIFVGIVIILYVLAWVFAKQWIDINISILGFSVLIANIGLLFFTFIKLTLLAKQKNLQNMLMGIFVNSSVLLIIYYLYRKGYLNVESTFIILGLIFLLATIYYWILFLKNSRIELLNINRSIKLHWSLGKWIAGSNIAYIFSVQIFPWLLLTLSTKENVAEFGVAMTTARLLAPVSQGLSSFLLPKLSHLRNNKQRFRRGLQLSFSCMILTASLLAIIGYYFGEKLVVLFFSDKYLDIGAVIFLAFLNQGINFINVPVDAVLKSLSKTDKGFKSVILSALFSIIFGVYLTMNMGVIGACIGLLMANIVGITYRLITLKSSLNGYYQKDSL